MMPFKVRYLIVILILTLTVVMGRIIYVNRQYEDISVNEYNMNETFDYMDMKVTVTKAEWLDEDDFEELYGKDKNIGEWYNLSIKSLDFKLLRVTVHAEGITRTQYKNMLLWDIVYGTTGNGVTDLADYINIVQNETPENMDIYLFFRCNPSQCKTPENIKYYVRTSLYPIQDIIHLEIE